MSTRILQAINFIETMHEGQVRRGTGSPYATHPLAVSYIVAASKQSKNLEDILIAALLHDVLEDTSATFDLVSGKFGPLVASLVLELTNDNAEIDRVGKLAYQKKKLAGISSYGVLIKLADRLHNVSENPTKKMLSDTLELVTFLKKARKLTLPQKSLISDIESICTSRLSLDGAVDDDRGGNNMGAGNQGTMQPAKHAVARM